MKSKTIFITVFHGFISKNFLNTKAFDILKNIPYVKYILLVPEPKAKFFRQTFQAGNIDVFGIDTVGLSNDRKVTFYSRLSHLLLPSHYLWYKKVERRDASKNSLRYLKYYLEISFTFLFGRIKIAKKIFRWFFITRVINDSVSKAFDIYKPDMLFSSDVFDDNDSAFSAEKI